MPVDEDWDWEEGVYMEERVGWRGQCRSLGIRRLISAREVEERRRMREQG